MLYSYIIEIMFVIVIIMLGAAMASVSAPRTYYTTTNRTTSVTSSVTSAAPAVSVAPVAPVAPVEEINDCFADDCNDMAALYIDMCHAFGIVHEVVYSNALKTVVDMNDDFTMGSIVVPFAKSYQWQVSIDGGRTWANATMEDNNTSCVVINHDHAGIYRCIAYTDRYLFVSNEFEVVDNSPMDMGGFIIRSAFNGDFAAAKEIAIDYLGSIFGEVAAARLDAIDIIVTEKVCNIDGAVGCAHLLHNCIDIKASLNTMNMAHVLIHEYTHFLIFMYKLNTCGLFYYQEAELTAYCYGKQYGAQSVAAGNRCEGLCEYLAFRFVHDERGDHSTLKYYEAEILRLRKLM